MDHSSFPSEPEKAISYKRIDVSCAAFNENEFIPPRYTCDGKDVNPALNLDHIPKESQSLAIIVDDPDAPGGTWVHWVIWNIPVTHHLKEGHRTGTQGVNDFNKQNYRGPCPPKGTHRYFFKGYALDCILEIPAGSNKADLEKAMAGHILGFGELIGLYKKQ
jgi:Raf kinase inhibitor-like YbhB/YbcL family protein